MDSEIKAQLDKLVALATIQQENTDKVFQETQRQTEKLIGLPKGIRGALTALSETTSKEDRKDTTKLISAFREQFTKMWIPMLMITKINALMLATFKQSNKLQKEALGRGSSLSKVMSRNTDVTTSFYGSLTGYQGALENTLAEWSSGLRRNNQSLTRLGIATKVTTGQNKQLYNTIAKNTAGMGFNNEQMSILADSTLTLSQEYGLTTNELVNAVGKLGEQLGQFFALGIGADMQEASLRLSAALGPAMADLGPEILGSLTKGSNLVHASLLGVTEQRQRLLNKEGDMTANAFDLVLTAGKNAEKLIGQFTQGAKDPAYALERASAIYGKDTIKYMQARQRMQELAKAQGLSLEAYVAQVKKQEEINTEFRATWENFKARVVSPFQRVFTKVAGLILKILDWPLVAELTSVIIGLVAGMSVLAILGSGLIGNMITLTGALIANTRVQMRKGLGKVMGKGWGKKASNLFRKFGGETTFKGKRDPVTGRFMKGGRYTADYGATLRKIPGVSRLGKTRVGMAARAGGGWIAKLPGMLKSGLRFIGPLLLRGFLAIGPLLKGAFLAVVPAIGTAIAAIPVLGWIAAGIALLVFIFRKQIMGAVKWVGSKIMVVLSPIGSLIMGVYRFLKGIFHTIFGALSQIPFIGGMFEGLANATAGKGDKLTGQKKYSDGLADGIKGTTSLALMTDVQLKSAVDERAAKVGELRDKYDRPSKGAYGGAIKESYSQEVGGPLNYSRSLDYPTRSLEEQEALVAENAALVEMLHRGAPASETGASSRAILDGYEVQGAILAELRSQTEQGEIAESTREQQLANGSDVVRPSDRAGGGKGF